jgi:APA family basic amino acid/polyamine antiporter
LSLVGATAVVMANMIGTGIFTTTGLLLGMLESGWLVLLCWLAGGLVALAGALSYAELATMMPRAGGEYVYLRHIYGPLPAFLSGWTSFFVGFAAPVAAAAVAFAFYLTAAGLLPGTWAAQKTAAVGVVLLFTGVHYTGLRWGARVQNALTGLNLVLISGMLLAGFVSPRADWRFWSTDAFLASGQPANLATALLWVMFAYSGWNAAAYLGEEVERPERTLPRSLLVGTLAVTALYLALNLFYFAAAPPEKLRKVEAVAGVAMRELFGPSASGWLAMAVAVALASALSAFMLVGPRVYFAMARDGLFFPFAVRIHPRFATPSLSIVAQGICAALMALTGTFAQLLTYIGFALGIFPWLTVLGVFLMRRHAPQAARPYRVWGYPVVPAFYLTVMAWVMLASLGARPGPPLIALATVAAGIPAYLLLRRRG